MNLTIHNDRQLFRESVIFTSQQTGFNPQLIEKDYMCSVVLNFLSSYTNGSLIFKGGTCLAKVYWSFNRLSEDLDFIIPMPTKSKRKERYEKAKPYKQALENLPIKFPIFKLTEPLEGKNDCRQYLATISYDSIVSGNEEIVKLEVGLREPLILNSMMMNVSTLLQNAANVNDQMVSFTIECLKFEEALAEKFRAALSRKDVAIRDFYDIDYAVLKKGLKINTTNFLDMVKKKLAVPGNDSPNMSIERISALSGQLESRLKPVLRDEDYKAFDLDRAIKITNEVFEQIKI